MSEPRLGLDVKVHSVYDLCTQHYALLKRSVTKVYSVQGFVFLNTRGADKSTVRPTSRCILFDGENISFDASLVIYINSTNIHPIMIINRIHEHQNLLSL